MDKIHGLNKATLLTKISYIERILYEQSYKLVSAPPSRLVDTLFSPLPPPAPNKQLERYSWYLSRDLLPRDLLHAPDAFAFFTALSTFSPRPPP